MTEVCRYCHEPAEERAPLLTPCRCTNPVHGKCLQKWLDTQPRQQCELCQQDFSLQRRKTVQWYRLFWAMIGLPLIGLLLAYVPFGFTYQEDGVGDDLYDNFFFVIGIVACLFFLPAVASTVMLAYGRLFTSSSATEWNQQFRILLIPLIWLFVLGVCAQLAGVLLTRLVEHRWIFNLTSWGVGSIIVFGAVGVFYILYRFFKKVDLRSDYRKPLCAFGVMPLLVALDPLLVFGVSYSMFGNENLIVVVFGGVTVAVIELALAGPVCYFYWTLYQREVIDYDAMLWKGIALFAEALCAVLGVGLHEVVLGSAAWNFVGFALALWVLGSLALVVGTVYCIYWVCRALFVTDTLVLPE